MATRRLTPYERAERRATRAFAETLTALDETRQLLAFERWQKAQRVLDHFTVDVEGCVCEGCMFWREDLRIHLAGRARN